MRRSSLTGLVFPRRRLRLQLGGQSEARGLVSRKPRQRPNPELLQVQGCCLQAADSAASDGRPPRIASGGAVADKLHFHPNAQSSQSESSALGLLCGRTQFGGEARRGPIAGLTSHVMRRWPTQPRGGSWARLQMRLVRRSVDANVTSALAQITGGTGSNPKCSTE